MKKLIVAGLTLLALGCSSARNIPLENLTCLPRTLSKDGGRYLQQCTEKNPGESMAPSQQFFYDSRGDLSELRADMSGNGDHEYTEKYGYRISSEPVEILINRDGNQSYETRIERAFDNCHNLIFERVIMENDEGRQSLVFWKKCKYFPEHKVRACDWSFSGGLRVERKTEEPYEPQRCREVPGMQTPLGETPTKKPTTSAPDYVGY